MNTSPGRTVRVALVAFAAAMLFMHGGAARAADPPSLPHYVNDLAGVMSEPARTSLDNTLSEYDKSTSSQFVVLIVPSLEGESIEDFSLAVAEKNGIGRKGKDNGLLLVVAVNDRKMRFEVGYGLEGVLTDALTSAIITSVIAPAFRSGDYDAGITQGMQSAIKAASGEFTVPEPPRRASRKRGTPAWVIILLIILFVIFRGGKGRRGRGGFFIFPGGFGGGGGGFSGGGFGGGGFSGGGGGFGGGGSSGSW